MNDGLVFWLTGLSGAGKSTIAEGVRTALKSQGLRVETLDGDDVRKRLHTDLGFTPSDNDRNNLLIADMCVRDRQDCDVILVPVISPFAASRRKVRNKIGDGFYEVFVSTALDVAQARDPKGLYAQAARGEIENFIGVSLDVPYEPPSNADLTIDTSRTSPKESVSLLFDFIHEMLNQRAEFRGARP